LSAKKNVEAEVPTLYYYSVPPKGSIDLSQAQDLINKLKLELTNFKAENKKLKDKVASLLPYVNDTASNKKPLSVSNLLTNVSVETALHLA